MDILQLIGRTQALFSEDLAAHEQELSDMVAASRFLVIGGAGSIGQAVSKELFRRNPRKLHIVDLSENNLTELVRDIRSSFGYIGGDFRTSPSTAGSSVFDAFGRQTVSTIMCSICRPSNTCAAKRSHTLMRMIDVNIFNTIKTLKQAREKGKNTLRIHDKAANPANMMGATKRIMEMFDAIQSRYLHFYGPFWLTWLFRTILVAKFRTTCAKTPAHCGSNDVKRYFVTPGIELCLLSTLLGENRDIFSLAQQDLHLQKFSDIATLLAGQRARTLCAVRNKKPAN